MSEKNLCVILRNSFEYIECFNQNHEYFSWNYDIENPEKNHNLPSHP